MKKITLITGAGRWIGQQVAIHLAQQGHHVILLGRSQAPLLETQQKINAFNGVCDVHCVDLTDEGAVMQVMQCIESDHGVLHHLFHAAAIYPSSLLSEMTVQEWKEVIEVNLTGSFIITQAVFPLMKKAAYGRLIYASSIAGNQIGLPGLAHYAASKAGLTGLMRTAALEWAQEGVTANSLEMGNFIHQSRFSIEEKEYAAMCKAIPLRRTGVPEDVFGLVDFLCSPSSSYLTGQTIAVDGGSTIDSRYSLDKA